MLTRTFKLQRSLSRVRIAESRRFMVHDRVVNSHTEKAIVSSKHLV